MGMALITSWPAAWAAPGTLHWDRQQKKIDADVQSWDLPTLLGRLSAVTGWDILVEPGTEQTVTVRFKGLPLGEALKRMLGELNFALLPQPKGLPKLFIFRTSLQDATQLVREEGPVGDGPAQKGAIPNELIVTLRSGANQTIDALARALGAEVIGKVDGLNTYRLRFADETAAQAARETLATDPDVAATDSNFLVNRPTRADGLEAGSLPGFSLKPKLGDPGKQVIVALIDTAVQPLNPKFSEFLLPAIHVSGSALLAQDELMHGTSMAETILRGLQFAPAEAGGSSVRVLPVDVYGNRPDTTTFDVAKGIYAALAAGASVVNLSLGGEGDSQFLASLIQAAHRQGVLFFGAAGNQPTVRPTFPAAYPEVVAVTAGDKRGNIAPYANRGEFVDVIGPGLSLIQREGQSYLVRGTSAATAYLSGTAAGIRAGGVAPLQVESLIREKFAVGAPQGP